MGSIELIVYDFDGVMTDNKIYMDQHGNETEFFFGSTNSFVVFSF